MLRMVGAGHCLLSGGWGSAVEFPFLSWLVTAPRSCDLVKIFLTNPSHISALFALCLKTDSEKRNTYWLYSCVKQEETKKQKENKWKKNEELNKWHKNRYTETQSWVVDTGGSWQAGGPEGNTVTESKGGKIACWCWAGARYAGAEIYCCKPKTYLIL